MQAFGAEGAGQLVEAEVKVAEQGFGEAALRIVVEPQRGFVAASFGIVTGGEPAAAFA